MTLNRFLFVAFVGFGVATSGSVQGQSIVPLTSFGGGDGYISATDSTTDYLTQFAANGTTVSNTERGLGYSATTNHLYLASREAVIDPGLNVRILDAVTGADIGALDTTGIAGGTFALSKIAVGADGLIYGTNLRTGTTATTYEIYRWDTEIAAPVSIFDALPDTDARIGDDLDAIGSGASTRLVAGYGIAATAPNSNGYLIVDPAASAATPTTPVFSNVAFPEGTGAGQTADGAFRLGITFVSSGVSGTVIGTQGGSLTAAQLTDYAGTVGLVQTNLTLQSTAERVMDFASIGGVPVLATMEVGGTATVPLTTAGTVRLYDIRHPASPLFLTSANNMPAGAQFENVNFGGDLRWGTITGNTATLYALSTNNGIQAFTVTIPIPEPSTAALFGFALAGFAIRRRRA